MKPAFSRNLLNDFASIEQQTERFLAALAVELCSAWTEDVDILERFSGLAMDIATDFFFGRSVGSQSRRTKPQTGINKHEAQIGDHTHGADQEFVEAFDLTTLYTMQRALAQELYFLRDGRKFRKSVAILLDTPMRLSRRLCRRESRILNRTSETNKRLSLTS